MTTPNPALRTIRQRHAWAFALLRWLLTGFMFIYLFALALTLFEIDAFQSLVARLVAAETASGRVTDPVRVREALQAVRCCASADDEHPGGIAWPEFVQRLVLRLDAVEQALPAAPGQSPPGEAPELSAALAGLAAELGPLEAARDKLETLNAALAALERKLTDSQAPADLKAATRQVNETVKALRASLAELGGVAAIREALDADDPKRERKALLIWREYQALGRYQRVLTPFKPFWPDHSVGFSASDMATMSRQALDLMLVMVMGAIGSLIYMVRYLLDQVMFGRDGARVWRPISWYLFRPLFGIVVAFAVFLLYKTGQVALGAGSADALASEVNLPILAVVSLFAGLLSWQALEMVESKGKRWLSAQIRVPLWAAGLEQALRQAGRSRSDCAAAVGVSTEQVERWVAGLDKVTAEMQDRIATWLNRDRDELFSDRDPKEFDALGQGWAVQLRAVLKQHPTINEPEQLARLLDVEVRTVDAWLACRQPVDAGMQLRIAGLLGCERADLFTDEAPGTHLWAVGLRDALARGKAQYRRAEDLAAAIGATRLRVRRWMELKDPVPPAVGRRIAEALGVGEQALFRPERPAAETFRWAVGLREALFADAVAAGARDDRPRTVLDLAERLDTEPDWVRDWLEQDSEATDGAPAAGQVAPATQTALAALLGGAETGLFARERQTADFRWPLLPFIAERVHAQGGVAQVADRLDLEPARVKRWLDGEAPIAPATRRALCRVLGLGDAEAATRFLPLPGRATGGAAAEAGQPGAAWAIGLRDALLAIDQSLPDLAEALDRPLSALVDQIELRRPVAPGDQQRVLEVVGPRAPDGGAVFSNEPPAFGAFQWAPGLRTALAAVAAPARELAAALGVPPELIFDWQEQDLRPVGGATDGLARGQLAPGTARAIAAWFAERGADDDGLFAAAPAPASARRFAVRPAFALAVEALGDGEAEFLEQVDVDAERLARWRLQQEALVPATVERVLAVFGLAPEDEAQLFDQTPREESAVA